MINKNNLRKAISSIAISNAKRNTIYKAFSDLDSITKEEFDSVKSDISKVVESMLTKDTVGKSNGVASLDSNGSVPIEQLGNIDTTLFLIVRELPTTDIKTNKIYLVPNKDSQGNNIYVEYLYVENVWENLGEFKPEVNLSGYVTSDEIYQCIKKDYDSSKRGTNSIAIDDSAKASGENATALGYSAKATKDNATALGSVAKAIGIGSIAIGNNAQATQFYSIAVGLDTQATGYNAIALGSNVKAIGECSIVLGHENAQATKENAIALGSLAQATGSASIALGDGAQATGIGDIALGFYAITSTVSKYALGGIDENKLEIFNLEEITYSQYGNKKYLIGLGGYDGTNITIDNEAGEKVLNPNIKSVQEIINEKADLIGGKLKAEQLPKLVNVTTASTAEEVVTKFNALLADLKAKGYMEADTAQ